MRFHPIILPFLVFLAVGYVSAGQNFPVAPPGTQLIYTLSGDEKPADSVVDSLALTCLAAVSENSQNYQWIRLAATKVNNDAFTCWMLCSAFPSPDEKTASKQVLRYIFQQGRQAPVQYSHAGSDYSLLPATGAWPHLLPRSGDSNTFVPAADTVHYLGLEYRLLKSEIVAELTAPPAANVIRLSPDLLIGVPHNSRTKDDTRRYDDSDYEYVRLSREDYAEMIDAGLNCLRVDAEQAGWIEGQNVYYWGIGGQDITFPEQLYKSNYIGPALFFDEPMVGTRDYVIRPKMRENPHLRKSMTPFKFFQAFQGRYHETKYEGGPTSLLKGLAARKDVDIGDMSFLQQNIYTWETMVSSALYQLSEGNNSLPNAMVFEPPGRVGHRRTLPELDMSFDCQIPTLDPKNLTSIIFGFLRGAARLTGKEWGVSIYGQVDKADSYWFFTHAYDLGATLFHFWDNHRLACVPYSEYLAITRVLKGHARNFPNRDLEALKQAAEVAIIIPPGYNLGHVYLGRGVISGLPALNLERKNSFGVSYRRVMSNFYIEIERCQRLGIEFDLFWDLEHFHFSEYREVVYIREDGTVAVEESGSATVYEAARVPARPAGLPPELDIVSLTVENRNVTAIAHVRETAAPVYYTPGADSSGVYHNHYAMFELYGPEEEDYDNLWEELWNVSVRATETGHTAEINFTVPKPGEYRLRVSTVDVAGRSAVLWRSFNVFQ